MSFFNKFEFLLKTLLYTIRISEDESGNVNCIEIPRLGIKINLSGHGQTLSLGKCRKMIEQALQAAAEKNEVVSASDTVRDLQKKRYLMQDRQYESFFKFNIKQRPGVFETILPTFGKAVIFGSALCNAFTVVLSLTVTYCDKKQEHQQDDIILGVLGATFAMMTQIIDYFFSMSPTFFAQAGRSLDDRRRKKSPFEQRTDFSYVKETKEMIAMYTICSIIIIILLGHVSLVSTLSPYKATQVLLDKAIECGQPWMKGWVKRVYPYLAGGFIGSASFSFHMGFTRLAIESVRRRYSRPLNSIDQTNSGPPSINGEVEPLLDVVREENALLTYFPEAMEYKVSLLDM